ncbi:MAG TPA: amidase [Vicinamibacterales bacterium]|nr:amidase [Vicinamibacterales bacterium]
MTIADAASRLRDGTQSSVDLVTASLQAIAACDADTHAFIRVDAQEAQEAARRADAEIRAGHDRGPLHGIPISLKDLIDVAGQPTTAASKVLADSIAQADAPIVTRLREAGVVLLGKTNLHEFALGTTSEDSAYGPVRHPRDLTRSAGGSSGGSAVAVATGMGLASIGSDTGGSIRIPASCCGIVGLKPGHGEIPTDGVVPLSVSLDHIGPLTLTVQDARWLWEALRGVRPGSDQGQTPEARSLRLSSVNGYFSVMAPEVRAAFDAGLGALRAAGTTIEMGTIDRTDTITKTYVDIVLPEAARWHDRYLDTRGPSYTPAVRARLASGREISAVDYLSAREAQAQLRRAVDAELDGVDALVLPTLVVTAPAIGSTDAALGSNAPVLNVRAAMLRNTQLFNLTGHPAISLPLRAAGLPVGLQLVGRHGGTSRLLEIAAACEKIISPPVG